MFARLHDKAIGRDCQIEGDLYHSFVSADYLGLAKHEAVKQNAIEAIERYGTSFSVGQYTDRTPEHNQLAASLAKLSGCEEAVITGSGYVANLVAISHLAKTIDLFLIDELSHNSIITASQQVNSAVEKFPHNDLVALSQKLEAAKETGMRVCVITESVFSADGDCADLDKITKLKNQYEFILYVDAAHSLGTFNGVEDALPNLFSIKEQVNKEKIQTEKDKGNDKKTHDIDWVTGSLNKTFASCGGYVASRKNAIEKLSKRNGYYLFSTGITPSNIAAALTAIRVLTAEESRHKKLYTNIKTFRRLAKEYKLSLGESDLETPIFTIMVNPKHFDGLYDVLIDNKIHVQALKFPAVERSSPRLRVLINCDHDIEQIKTLITVVSGFLSAAN